MLHQEILNDQQVNLILSFVYWNWKLLCRKNCVRVSESVTCCLSHFTHYVCPSHGHGGHGGLGWHGEHGGHGGLGGQTLDQKRFDEVCFWKRFF